MIHLPRIEMRFVVPYGTHVPPSIPRLQFRYLIEPLLQWTEWEDVPTVVEKDQ